MTDPAIVNPINQTQETAIQEIVKVIKSIPV